MIIAHRLASDFHDDPDEYYNYLLNTLHTTYANNISQWTTCPSADESKYFACSTTWIDEDADLNCAEVYRDEEGQPMNSSTEFHLGDTYYNTRIVFLEQRLLQGGVRLGTVINKIVQSQKTHHHKKDKHQFCSVSLFIFPILLFEVCFLFCAAAYCFTRRRAQRQPAADLPPPYYATKT